MDVSVIFCRRHSADRRISCALPRNCPRPPPPLTPHYESPDGGRLVHPVGVSSVYSSWERDHAPPTVNRPRYGGPSAVASSLGCLARTCLSCPALPCLALPCPALPCLALPCPALPCLADLDAGEAGEQFLPGTKRTDSGMWLETLFTLHTETSRILRTSQECHDSARQRRLV